MVQIFQYLTGQIPGTLVIIPGPGQIGPYQDYLAVQTGSVAIFRAGLVQNLFQRCQ